MDGATQVKLVASAYNPDARFDLVVSDVELRRNAAGRMLMARIYQPKGKGPFPAVLDLHGGAWTRKDRLAEEPMDRALASSGLLVVAVDLTLAAEAPYPACVQDANHAVRWLKANAARWNGDASKLGVYGSSSGGHVAELLAMRPHDPRYCAIPVEGARDVDAPQFDATVSWVAMRSPPSNTVARYENAEHRKNETMIQSNRTFFSPWESIHEGNPQEILERGEKVALVVETQGPGGDRVTKALKIEEERVVKQARPDAHTILDQIRFHRSLDCPCHAGKTIHLDPEAVNPLPQSQIRHWFCTWFLNEFYCRLTI